ncbi:polyprenyl diphosphate synthase [Vulcanisaeta distributa]|uniref:Tritrans,polycis-undecaprenyl-diphosphate synthase (geranylgeranyl-diphosphate specific) n=1 Tax=Vulcanisaeta distributa (strain DSM 14429 / JCM 11212 / NBRC 100878 / IC-017) TaxID=572478 RepID=E1QPN2_VULDI|nr:polyprenyl diphosphate synthase [Vulcanisaeta distributa]ADN50328.1 undecaprenyl diphosphate synthase [Vulcanisaeta distributa DSM 14429]
MQGALPIHIGVIPDGNRRWARKVGLPITEAYRIGSDKVEEFLDWSLDFGIKIVTVYVLSTENFLRRSKLELDLLYRLLKEKLIKVRKDERIHRNRVRVRVIGRTWLLPEDVRREIALTEEATANYSDHYLNLAVVYGGRQEIIDAIKKILVDYNSGKLNISDLNEDTLFRYLYIGDEPYPEPDLIIRTGGEHRISNFLLYETAYSELYILNKYWPEITKEDLKQALDDYSRRERRFGK